MRILVESRIKQERTASHYNLIENKQKNIRNLQEQVDKVSQGNIAVASQKKRKFLLDIEQQFSNHSKKVRPVEETGYPMNTKDHRRLLKQCFNRYNRPLVNMVHTSEKIKHRSFQTKKKLDRMLDKVDLDRNFKLKEKMELLWADDDSSQDALSEGGSDHEDKPSLSLK